MLLERPIQVQEVVRRNVKGAFVPTKFAAIQFRQQRSGRIVNITSDAVLGWAGKSAYAAAPRRLWALREPWPAILASTG